MQDRNIWIANLSLLPVLKNGRCEFILDFGAKATSGKYFNGKLTGAMDFDVTGACSERKLRELLSKQMANEMIKATDSNIRE